MTAKSNLIPIAGLPLSISLGKPIPSPDITRFLVDNIKQVFDVYHDGKEDFRTALFEHQINSRTEEECERLETICKETTDKVAELQDNDDWLDDDKQLEIMKLWAEEYKYKDSLGGNVCHDCIYCTPPHQFIGEYALFCKCDKDEETMFVHPCSEACPNFSSNVHLLHLVLDEAANKPLIPDSPIARRYIKMIKTAAKIADKEHNIYNRIRRGGN